MKDKPTRHKMSNTFRFEGETEKYRKLRVSLREFLVNKPTDEEEDLTFLRSSLDEWEQKNCTRVFENFKHDLGQEIDTVAQILLNQDHITNTFIDHLQRENFTDAHEAILKVLAGFAMDIPQQFYQDSFYKLIGPLIGILKTKDTECIRQVFYCFVAIFEITKKYLQHDCFKLYHDANYCVLLSKAYPWYINELAAQSISFFARNISQKRTFLELVLQKLKTDKVEVEENLLAEVDDKKSAGDDNQTKNVKRILAKEKDQVEGVGKLLANMMKGEVVNRLHSYTSNIFVLLLSLVNSPDVNEDLCIEAILNAVAALGFHVTTKSTKLGFDWRPYWKEDSEFVWPVLWKQLNQITSEGRSAKAIILIIHKLITFKHAALVIDVNLTLDNLIAIFSTEYANECTDSLIETIACLFSSTNFEIPRRYVANISLQIFRSNIDIEHKISFINKVTGNILFDQEILPLTLEFLSNELTSEKKGIQIKVLEALSKIIIDKQPLLQCGNDFSSWRKQPLDFSLLLHKIRRSKNCLTVPGVILKVVESGFSVDFSNYEELCFALVCVSHVTPLDVTELAPSLAYIMVTAFEELLEKPASDILYDEDDLQKKKRKRKSFNEETFDDVKLDLNIKTSTSEEIEKLCFLISVVVEVMAHTLSPNDFLGAMSGLEIINIFEKSPQFRENTHLLKSLDIHLTVAAENQSELINQETFNQIYKLLVPCIGSSCSLTRLIVCHIFSIFPLPLPPPGKGKTEVESIFSIMLQAELCPITSYDFKERIRLVSALSIEQISQRAPLSGDYYHAPVLFLIGQLYVNFKPIWTPVIELIAGHALALSDVKFWPLFYSKLKHASYNAKQLLYQENDNSVDIDLNFNSPILSELYSSTMDHEAFKHLSKKLDHKNHRDLLWRCMQQFPEVCQQRNKIIVNLLFSFLEEEFYPVDYDVAPTQNILKKKKSNISILDITEDNDKTLNNSTVDMEIEDVEEEEKEELDDEELSSKRKTAPIKSLCEHLSLFARFTSAKALYKCERLETIFNDLLSHPSPTVQKVSLDCLFKFNYKYMIPYKDRLYRIVDDKTFKNEIVLFNIDGSSEEKDENTMIVEEHRENFMPILIRILFGKMQHKTGSNTSGKSSVGKRKAVILRFLAGAREEELQTFMNLAFDVILSHIKDSTLNTVNRILDYSDPSEIIPLKRMFSALTTLENIFEKLGSLILNKSGYLLKINLLVLANSVSLLNQQEKIRPHHISFLKKLRKLALQQLVLFFEEFSDYPWTNEEVEAVFKTAVWPSLTLLPDEGIYSTTPLMNLFMQWAENPRLHILFAKHFPGDKTLSPIPYIIKLVNHEKCSKQVINSVLKFIDLIMKPKDEFSEDLTNVDAPTGIEDLLSLDIPDNVDSSIDDLGIALLIPHMDGLLLCMKKILSNVTEVEPRDLNIMCHLSNWINSSKDSMEFLNIIIPLLGKRAIKEDKLVPLLVTCSRLLLSLENSQDFIHPILNLFSILEDRSVRAGLCDVVAAIAANNSSLQNLKDITYALNAWSTRRVDEIDYEQRLDAFQISNKCLKNCEEVDINLSLLIISNSIYIIKHVDDSALKDSANLALQNIVDMISRLYEINTEECNKLLNDALLPELRSSLRHKKSMIRDGSMLILGQAVRKCSHCHPRLKDLKKLSDNDPEQDFFENMSHIQYHRRTRVLAKLEEQLKNNSLQFSNDTLTQYLVPICSVVLLKEEYVKYDSLVSASISCLGALANLLPWFSYKTMLKYYLDLFSKDLSLLKQAIRILDVVIEAFHEEVDDSAFTMEKFNVDDKSKLVEINDTNLTKAQKIYRYIVLSMIPQLKNVFSAKTKSDSQHKFNKSKFPEDEDIKRIPLAFAIVKLLKKLPRKALDLNIHSIFMKLITFLKSKAESIRDQARNMLGKVIVELGGDYFSWLVRDMSSTLVRGFQCHVLSFTVHSLLVKSQTYLEPKHVEECLDQIVSICIEDLFSDKTEEKDVLKITGKIKEARGEKGYQTFGICAEIINVENLQRIMMPLKELLANTHSKKVVAKVSKCLHEITNGLERNKFMSLEHRSMFIYGILDEKIMELKANENGEATSKSIYERVDCLILEPEPKRNKIVPKTSINFTSYVFVEFSLKFLYSLLKHGKFSNKDNHHNKLIAPYLKLMTHYIDSDYPEVSLKVLQCSEWLIKFENENIEENIKMMCAKVFVILRKFSSPSLTKGKIFDLVHASFKFIAYVIRTSPNVCMTEDQIRILLDYVNYSLEDRIQSMSTLDILQAIIIRKIDIEDLHEIMKKIREMSISKDNPQILDNTRRIYFKYLTAYPFRLKITIENIKFYIGNLDYENLNGRLSACLMVNEIVTSFPGKYLGNGIDFSLWDKTIKQIIVEDSDENKKLLNNILKTVFERSNRKPFMIKYAKDFLAQQSSKKVLESAAALQIGAVSVKAILLANPKVIPTEVLTEMTPKVVSLLHPAIYNIDSDDEAQCILDVALQTLLEVFSKLFSLYSTDPKWNNIVLSSVWDDIKDHLLYPNIHVRIIASQIFSQLLTACESKEFDTPQVLKQKKYTNSIVLDLCEQLCTEAPVLDDVYTQLSLNVVKTLIILTKMSNDLPLLNKENPEDPLLDSVKWILHNLGDRAYDELRNKGKYMTTRREALLNYMAGIIVLIGEQVLLSQHISMFIIKHITREQEDINLPQVLAKKTQDLADIVRTKIGIEEYNKLVTSSKLQLNKKKWKRRADEKEMFVRNPEVAQMRKKKKQESKVISKKRKRAEKKGRPAKKKKVRDFAISKS